MATPSQPNTEELVDLDPAELPRPKSLKRQAVASVMDILNLPSIYTLPGAISTIVNPEDAQARAQQGEAPAYSLPGHQTAAHLADKYNQGVNDFLNIDDPQDAAELTARIGPGALLPVSWLGVGSKVEKLNKMLDATGKVAKGAELTGKAVDALIIPGVQGKYTATKAVANETLSQTIGHGATELVEDKNNPNDTAFDHIPGANSTTPDDLLDLDPSAIASHNNQEIVPYLDPQMVEQHEMNVQQEEDNHNRYIKGAALAGASLIGGYVTARAIKKGVEASIAKRAAPVGLGDDYSPLSQPKPSEGTTTPGQYVKGSLFDQNSILADQLEKAAGPEAANRFKAQAQLMNQVGVRTITDEAYNTGRYPLNFDDVNGARQIKVTPLKDIDVLAESLDPVKRNQLNDLLMAQDEIDTMKAKGIYAPDQKSLLGGKTASELETIMRALKQDPQVSSLARMYQDHPRAMLRYGEVSGLLDSKTAQGLRTTYPNFMPRVSYEQPRLSEMLFGGTKEKGDALDALNLPWSKERSAEAVARGQEYEGTFMPPTLVLKQEMRKLFRTAQVNNYRRMFLEPMNDADGVSKMQGVRQLSPEAAKNASNVIKYKVDGRDVFWKVKDPTIYSMLKNGGQAKQLNSIENGLNTMRQVKQFMTTGPINLPFSFVAGQMWEPIWTALVKPKGMTMGGLQAPAIGGIGFVKGLRAQHYERMASMYKQALLSKETGVKPQYGTMDFIGKAFRNYTQNMTPEQVSAMADNMAEMYARSPTAIYRAMGGGGTHAFDKFEQMSTLNVTDKASMRKALDAFRMEFDSAYKPDQMNRDWSGEKGWMRYYVGSIIDSLHNGVKYQLIDLNKPKDFKGVDQLDGYMMDLAKLAREARDTLDSSKQGTGKGALGYPNKMLSVSMPYYNVMMQGFNRLGRQYKENPAQMARVTSAIMLAGASTAWMNSRGSDEQRDWYWNTLTPEQRVGSAWFPNPTSDDPQDSIHLPLEPTTAFIFMMGHDLMDALTGISTGHFVGADALDRFFNAEDDTGLTPAERRAYDFKAGGHRLWGLARPPIADVAAGAYGKRFDQGGGLTDLVGQDVQEYNSISPGVPSRYVDGVVNAQWEAVMQGMFGTIGPSMAIDAIEGARMSLQEKPHDIWGALQTVKDTAIVKEFGASKVPVRTYTQEAREIKEFERAGILMTQKWDDVMKFGRSTKGGVQLPGRVPAGFDDPAQLALFQSIKPKMDSLRQIYRAKPGGISDLEKQRASIQSSGSFSVEQKQLKTNEINTQIQALTIEYLRGVQGLQGEIGQQIGQDEFDIRDWVDNGFKLQQPSSPTE